MDLLGCLKLSVPKNVATKEPVDLHFITYIPARYEVSMINAVTGTAVHRQHQ